eukprot:UN31483
MFQSPQQTQDSVVIGEQTAQYLFQTLQNCVEELYFFCDFQSNIPLCDRVLNVLNTSTKDVEDLRSRLVTLEQVGRKIQRKNNDQTIQPKQAQEGTMGVEVYRIIVVMINF